MKTKLQKLARKLGIASRNNGLSELLKTAQRRVDAAEQKAAVVFEQLQQTHQSNESKRVDRTKVTAC